MRPYSPLFGDVGVSGSVEQGVELGAAAAESAEAVKEAFEKRAEEVDRFFGGH